MNVSYTEEAYARAFAELQDLVHRYEKELKQAKRQQRRSKWKNNFVITYMQNLKK